MENAATHQPRSGKELILATKPFAIEDRRLSWWHTLSTAVLLAVTLFAAVTAPFWWLNLPISLLAGLVTVRIFILYHDHFHGALLSASPVARSLFTAYGLLVLTPRRVWKETHNYHHAHTAKIAGSHIGSYMMATTRMWARMTRWQRLAYRATRHPLTIVFGVLTIFAFGMCFNAFRRSPRKNWDSGVALLLHAGLAAGLTVAWGIEAYLYGLLIPLAVACAMGAYLFYAQHNFPDVDVRARAEWSYTHAATESSSYMEMGPIMRWFTGNIGYHHVHHLNPGIPFYRLPEAMAAIPELQNPGRTTLRPRDIVACFQLKLWDPGQGRMVGYPTPAAE